MRFSTLLALTFFAGISLGAVVLGSVPQRGLVTDDTALYQHLSEIKASKIRDINFDSDIAKLSELEGRYRETLPLKRVRHISHHKPIR